MNSNSVVLSPWLSRTWWVSWESAMSGIWRSFIFDSQRLFTDLPSERPFTCGPRHLRFHNTKIHWWFQNHQKMSRNIDIFSENHILYKPQRFMGDSLAFKPHATSLSSKFWFHNSVEERGLAWPRLCWAPPLHQQLSVGFRKDFIWDFVRFFKENVSKS